ncbi:hypothetical protein K458DRAFT_385939 [Lentithecium fluviatile CBS 122367]|uniref:Uncharacterized protein n=1 Tax=Lentithecium fluviatile CBS 122367 TaxID=1168545 RepID=A0A6G1J9M4_9PLEO|nr:hypothetical protein K458DRAFT_385939 [Lentithecium fluviatile CBS 122367]
MPREKHWLATTLFEQKELKYFLRWQRKFLPPDRRHILPTALEYEDYVYWYYEELSRKLDPDFVNPREAELQHFKHTIFEIAEKCGHSLHPAHHASQASIGAYERGEQAQYDGNTADLLQRCPMCTIEAHQRLMEKFAERWKKIGGPWRAFTKLEKNAYLDGREIYSYIKVPLVNDIDRLTALAKLEAEWEAAHPDEDIEVTREFSATNTVNLYFENLKIPAIIGSYKDNEWGQIQEVQKKLKEARGTTATSRLQRQVSFTAETLDGSHRKRAQFWRKMRQYIPGPHACPSPEGWANTSFMSSYPYAISQSRILLIERFPTAPEFVYRNLNCEPSFGDNKHVDRLIELVDDWLHEKPLDELEDSLKKIHEQGHWLVEKQIRDPDVIELMIPDAQTNEEEEKEEEFNRVFWSESLYDMDYRWAMFVGDMSEEEYKKCRDEERRKWAEKRRHRYEEEEGDDEIKEEGEYEDWDGGSHAMDTAPRASDRGSEEALYEEVDEISVGNEEGDEWGGVQISEDSEVEDGTEEEWTNAVSRN